MMGDDRVCDDERSLPKVLHLEYFWKDIDEMGGVINP